MMANPGSSGDVCKCALFSSFASCCMYEPKLNDKLADMWLVLLSTVGRKKKNLGKPSGAPFEQQQHNSPHT